MEAIEKKTQHTPGPWKIDDRDGAIFCDDNGVAICYLRNKHEDDLHNSQANARLIAAAPDLLDALQNAYMVLYGGNSVSIEDALNRVPFETMPLDFKMMTAIKKAKGL